MDKIKTRNARRAEKWKQNYIKQRNLYREIQKNASDIIQSKNFNRTKFHVQHGDMTVNSHCMNVAKYSLAISDKLAKIGISCKRNELVRGALLHDYFLYDWHKHPHVGITNLHGFRHPQRALENAEKEYNLTPRERDIIVKHMWPLTVLPPTCREAWIVTTADKWCSLLETFRILKGHGAKRKDKMQENE
ncbi:MAG: phosphohydrolase [Clostridium sp.]|nr:phosphohydrolase [Clostridium sp.]